MTLSLTRQELCSVVNGQTLTSDATISFRGVEFDSRNIKGGELFLAMPGARQHGHSYVSEVFSRGASLALVEDGELFDSHPEKDRIVVVPSTFKAFAKLAKWWREQLALPVLGITGSTGKTTVKEICAALLLQSGPGVYSLKSYNNHVGLPYTLCQASKEHKWCVLEMGMNAPGEMLELATVAQPDVAVITEVSQAHMEAFSSLFEVADAKLEILKGNPPPKVLIIPTTNKYILDRLPVHRADSTRVIYFSEESKGDQAECVVKKATAIGLDGWDITLQVGKELINFVLPMLGKHNVLNAASAVLAVKTLVPEITVQQIEKGFTRLRPPQMRLQKRQLANGAVIIDDSYNASPNSMRAALEVLSSCREIKPDCRIGCVLGEMLELGQEAKRLHLELGEDIASIRPDFLIALGNFNPEMVKGCKREKITYFEVQSAEAAAHTALKCDFDFLLIKGSRGIGLDRTVEVLIEKIGLEVPPSGADFKFHN